MKHIILPLVILSALLLTGCGFGSPTQNPTSTPTPALMIRVPSPTSASFPSPSPRPTIEPTISVSATVTATDTVTVTIPTATPTPASVSELPDPSSYSWPLVASGLDKPEGLVNAGDGSGRLFVIEQGGLIRVLKDGVLLPTPFLDLTKKVSCCGEKGLLGLAFHPKYVDNGYFFVDYTETVNNQLYTVVSRYND
jgi:glucose/arabinose dehydrogenase